MTPQPNLEYTVRTTTAQHYFVTTGPDGNKIYNGFKIQEAYAAVPVQNGVQIRLQVDDVVEMMTQACRDMDESYRALKEAEVRSGTQPSQR